MTRIGISLLLHASTFFRFDNNESILWTFKKDFKQHQCVLNHNSFLHMALTFGDLGLSLTSGISPLPLATVQGNDLINLTFHFNYNGTKDVLLENSTACQELNKTSVFLNFVITFPVVLEIVYPANASNYSGNIDTDFSNCSFSPSLEIDLQNVPSGIQIGRASCRERV